MTAAPSPVVANSPATSSVSTTSPVAQRDWRPSRVTITALGIAAPISPMGLNPDGTVEVPALDRPDLVGWYSGSPAAGDPGPTVLLAHASVNGIPGAFLRLGEARVGTEIAVTRGDGTTIRYAVTRVATYAKAQFPTEEVYGDRPGPELRLITCARTGLDARSFDANTVVYAVPLT
ncbi:MAG: class F sortase [Actinomycetales bacterium]|nr:class F sortase [Actinomycetales bacterium]